MSYIDSGFNSYLQRQTYPSAQQVSTEDATSQAIPILTGASVAGGVTESQSGRIRIDWELGQILVGDGANWRVLIGEDGL